MRLMTVIFSERSVESRSPRATIANTGQLAPCKSVYSGPALLCVAHATELILERTECQSKQVAKRLRRLIDECGGNLSCSPARECRSVQVELSLVSRQFKKLYHVTLRAYSRQVRMKNAERLLRESKGLNVNETAQILGYSFTSAFSRCFQKVMGSRPKRYQMHHTNRQEPWLSS